MRRFYGLSLAVCIFLTGCATQGHPDYALFSHVPPQRIAKVKAVIKYSKVKNVELPTKYPYPVTNANVHGNYKGAPLHQMDIYIGDSTKHVLDIHIQTTGKNAIVSPSTMEVVGPVVKATNLSDGTKAIYTKNDRTSQLIWARNGVLYTMLSTNNHNRPDLTEQQLISVANSFK